MHLLLSLTQIILILQKRRIDCYVGYITEIVNEILLVLLQYAVMGYGLHVDEGSALYTIGYVNIFLIYVCICINGGIMIHATVRRLILWCRYRFCVNRCMLWVKGKCRQCKGQTVVQTQAVTEQPESQYVPDTSGTTMVSKGKKGKKKAKKAKAKKAKKTLKRRNDESQAMPRVNNIELSKKTEERVMLEESKSRKAKVNNSQLIKDLNISDDSDSNDHNKRSKSTALHRRDIEMNILRANQDSGRIDISIFENKKSYEKSVEDLERDLNSVIGAPELAKDSKTKPKEKLRFIKKGVNWLLKELKKL